MDDNTRLDVLAKKKVRTTHQDDGSPFAFHLQNMPPGGLKFLMFAEGNCKVPMWRHRTHQSA